MAELGEPAGHVPSAVRRWLERWPPGDLPHGAAGAAVTIVLREGRRDVEVLLIERSVRDGDIASGQVALPGGRADDADESMRATALRELHEEVGLGPADLVGTLGLVGVEEASLFNMHVAVYSAALGPSPGPRAADPHEVAHVFWLPVTALDTVEPVERATRSGLRKVPAIVHEGHVLWGFTFRVLRQFFDRPEPATPPG
ncbi:MAG: CoA pyrophosphatase [Thermoplasmata archaeon]|nr:CoA pyrophosphatase [Thermoplasmata archaeon]